MKENTADVSARPGTMSVFVRQIRFEGNGINSYELVDAAGNELPPFAPGAHIDVHLVGGALRQYSLCNDPQERHRYVIAVLRDEGGRGGSKTLHETLRVQDFLSIGPPRNNFWLVPDAKKVILLAGGIGVTPLKSMAHLLEREGIDYELHYCAKDLKFAAFAEEMVALSEKGRVHFHFDGGDPTRGLDIAKLLREPSTGTHLYYCGPGGFMKACAAASAHWPAGTVHFEHFKAPDTIEKGFPASDTGAEGGSFDVQIARSGQRIHVGADESLADALNKAGVPVETSCQSGLCGTCKIRYLTGQVDHRDFILNDEEREEFLTACVSRSTSDLLTLDL